MQERNIFFLLWLPDPRARERFQRPLGWHRLHHAKGFHDQLSTSLGPLSSSVSWFGYGSLLSTERKRLDPSLNMVIGDHDEIFQVFVSEDAALILAQTCSNLTHGQTHLPLEAS